MNATTKLSTRVSAEDAPTISLQLDSILVPTDFSKNSYDAIKTAVSMLAGNARAQLTLLHVTDPLSLLSPIDATPPAVDVDRCLLLAKNGLSELKKQFVQSVAQIDPQVKVGSPANVIVETSASGQYDLLVMSSHGRSGIRRLVLGSVAEGVVNNARCPVLVTKAHASSADQSADIDLLHQVKRIVVGYDGRQGALKAMEMAAAIAERCNAGITLVQALPSVASGHSTQLPFKAMKLLETDHIPLGHLSKSHPFVAKPGNPWEVIADAARELVADLVVVGPHAYQERGLHFLGSTAQRLLRFAPCAVLAV